MSKTISVKSYAKLNLYLDIVGKRNDGYHLLQSVMQSISLYDILNFTLENGNDIKISCNITNIPLDSKNLVWKAVEAFYEYVPVKKQSVSVSIEKHIPQMAGMAGGSSNAAAALVAMNELYDNPLSVEELCKIGENLGADVPFCIIGGTVLCEGVGEILTKLRPLPDCYLAVAKPDIGISTPEAYRLFDSMTLTDKPDYNNFKKGLETGCIKTIADNLYNSLEIACGLKDITKIKQYFIDNHALNSIMTGSGSAVFGMFTENETAKNALAHFNNVPFKGVFTPVNNGIEVI